jgi:hypothetical protein
MTAHLGVTQEAGRAFSCAPPAGPVVMLNLPRFRAVADDAAHPQLAPPAPISGEEACRRYVAHTAPFLEKPGGEVLFIGPARAFPIGPESERRDAAMRVRQRDAQAFLAFASDPACMAGTGHRVAAPEDSRLLPPTEGP